MATLQVHPDWIQVSCQVQSGELQWRQKVSESYYAHSSCSVVQIQALAFPKNFKYIFLKCNYGLVFNQPIVDYFLTLTVGGGVDYVQTKGYTREFLCK